MVDVDVESDASLATSRDADDGGESGGFPQSIGLMGIRADGIFKQRTLETFRKVLAAEQFDKTRRGR